MHSYNMDNTAKKKKEVNLLKGRNTFYDFHFIKESFLYNKLSIFGVFEYYIYKIL